MAQLGFRTMDEMIGRVDRLDVRAAVDHWKARGLDFSAILHRPDVGPDVAIRRIRPQDHGLERSLDVTTIVPRCQPALESRTPVDLRLPIRNVNRTVGTILGYEVTSRYGADGLPDDTIRIHFTGSAGQSFGAFVPRGITLVLEGDANDYLGKGLSGGQDRRLPAARGDVRARRTTSSSATSCSTARRAARPTSAGWPASASPCGTAARWRWSRASATTRAST